MKITKRTQAKSAQKKASPKAKPKANLEPLIREAFASTDKPNSQQKSAIQSVIELLSKGQLRVAEKQNGGSWHVHEWLKMAVLLYFRIQQNQLIPAGPFAFFDKIPVKRWKPADGVRVVPQAIVRHGAYVAPGAILMPSYVNIGAYVDSGTMVDTWATVGSCAQIGKNVHLSGGVGIGGVLEPLQASPVIVEDDAFIGSRCIVVEGVVIERGAVLGAGVTITASSRIVDVTGSTEKVFTGRVPQNAIVIPGSREKQFPAGKFQVPCALIIGHRTETTNQKVSINSLLRDYGVAT